MSTITNKSFEELRQCRRMLIAASDTRLVGASVRFYQTLGYEAYAANSADELLNMLRDNRPQVVLLSVEICKESIPSIIKAIKGIDPDCNILLFAREEDSELIKNAWRSGAFYFLKQGATPNEIIPEIDRAFEDYFGRVQVRYLRKSIFVIMPFSDEYSDIYEFGIKLAVTECEMVCERVDEEHFTESILEKIFESIRRARLIVADVTGNNPNVFFEVGYARALGKPIIYLSRDDAETIPFDLRHNPHIVYEGKIGLLQQKLKDRLRGLLEKRVGL